MTNLAGVVEESQIWIEQVSGDQQHLWPKQNVCHANECQKD
jgi:hypothetical protein